MFILAEMQDIIRIEPWKFGLDMNHVITSMLNKKFANKVVHKVGLCIALYDITHVSDSYLFPGDGSSHTKVRFRFIVFRPFIDEVLVGKIRSSSPDGIRVSLGFFDDILISPQSMQYPSRFDADEQVWVWEYETEDGKNDMFMDEGEEIRFKIVEEVFIEISPTIQSSMQGAEATVAIATSTTVADSNSHESKKESPYTIQGSISESGLGLLSWWAG